MAENATASGVTTFAIADWVVRYPGFPYIEWLTTIAPAATSRHYVKPGP